MLIPASARRIGIWGHYGTFNLGDEAIITAVIENILRRRPDAQLVGFSSNPRDTVSRYRVPAFPVRRWSHHAPSPDSDRSSPTTEGIPLHARIVKRCRSIPIAAFLLKILRWGFRAIVTGLHEASFLVASYRVLKGIDVLVIAGSGQLSDHFGGAWCYPYTIFKWSILTRAAGARLVFLSMGAGPVRSSLSGFFIKHALAVSDYSSFRDATSQNLIGEIGVRGVPPVFPDLAHSLTLNGAACLPSPAPPGRHVGINPFPHYDPRYWPFGNPAAYRRYIQTIAVFVNWLTHQGYHVTFFATQLRADPPVIQDIKDVLAARAQLPPDSLLSERPLATVDDLIAQISAFDVVVATRFHGILLAFLLNKPVLALSNQPKMADLMHAMGQSDYLLDAGTMDLETLTAGFSQLQQHRTIIVRHIAHRRAESRRALDDQYDQLFGPTPLRAPDVPARATGEPLQVFKGPESIPG